MVIQTESLQQQVDKAFKIMSAHRAALPDLGLADAMSEAWWNEVGVTIESMGKRFGVSLRPEGMRERAARRARPGL